MKYEKKPLTVDEHIGLLRERGLGIEDRDYARSILQEINYYRLSAYFHPFLEDKANHLYKQGSTLEQVVLLYRFDTDFRQLLIPALESAEIVFRQRITYHLAHRYNDPFCYLQKSIYSEKFQGAQIAPEELYRSFGKEEGEKNWQLLILRGNINRKGRILDRRISDEDFKEDTEELKRLIQSSSFENWMKMVENSIQESHEEFVRHYKDKYLQDSQGFPIWMMSEMVSFGNLSKFYSGLSTENRRAISVLYGIPHRLLSQWLHSLVYLRNICAHHARLWNRDMVIAPKKPRDLPEKDFWSKKLFSLLLVLKHLTALNFCWAGFTEELQNLLQKYPDVDANAMGFPVNWKEVLVRKEAKETF